MKINSADNVSFKKTKILYTWSSLLNPRNRKYGNCAYLMAKDTMPKGNNTIVKVSYDKIAISSKGTNASDAACSREIPYKWLEAYNVPFVGKNFIIHMIKSALNGLLDDMAKVL